MAHNTMYTDNKDSYLNLRQQYYIQQFGYGINKSIQFILFGDVMSGHIVWFLDMNMKKIDFVKKLKKIGDVIILKPNYINFMGYSKITKGINWYCKPTPRNVEFSIDDLQYENYADWVFGQIDKNKKYIAISLQQGSHFAKFFCNKYPDNCMALYVLGDRNLTQDSYENAFHSENNYKFLRSIVGDDYKKYIIENLTDKTISELLEKIKNDHDNEKYIEMLNGLCKGIIRSQYKKIDKLHVNAIIYSDVEVITPEKLKNDKKISETSPYKIIHYYVSPSSYYLIHDRYANDIFNSIYGLIKATKF